MSDVEQIRRLRAGWRKGEPVPPELLRLLAYAYQLAFIVIFKQACESCSTCDHAIDLAFSFHLDASC